MVRSSAPPTLATTTMPLDQAASAGEPQPTMTQRSAPAVTVPSGAPRLQSMEQSDVVALRAAAPPDRLLAPPGRHSLVDRASSPTSQPGPTTETGAVSRLRIGGPVADAGTGPQGPRPQQRIAHPEASTSRSPGEVASLVVPLERDRVAPQAATPELSERTPQTAATRVVSTARVVRTRRLRPGDLICGHCGEGNNPSRKFCSRCGGSLVEAHRVEIPWWRKILRRRGVKVLPISDVTGPDNLLRAKAPGGGKHLLRKVYRRLRLSVGLLLVLASIVYGSYPPFRSAINSHVKSVTAAVRRHVDIHYVPERPVSVTANLDTAGHPGSLATDGFTNTYWDAPYSISKYPVLTLKLGHRTTLEKMILNSGDEADYTSHGRPALIVLLFSNDETMTITPEDTPKPQTLNISHAVEITSVQIEIEGVFSGPADDVAIGNIELFGIG